MNKKIELAKAASPKFRELITTANDPDVRWEANCWPGFSPAARVTWRGRITLNPTRGDVFATFVFELTNAVASLTPLRKSTEFDNPLEYAYQIEYQEYIGNMWANEVITEINIRQNYFKVEERYSKSIPDQKRFLSHLKEQHIGQHTEMYFEQWTTDKQEKAKAERDWSAELDRAETHQQSRPSLPPISAPIDIPRAHGRGRSPMSSPSIPRLGASSSPGRQSGGKSPIFTPDW